MGYAPQGNQGALGAEVDLGELAILTTKGDLLTYGTAHERLAVGADGLVLTAQADGSAAWEALPSGTLAAALTAGNTTGGADLEVSSGDSITGAAAADLALNAVTGQAIDLNVNDVTEVSIDAGGIDIASGNAIDFLGSGAGFIDCAGVRLLTFYSNASGQIVLNAGNIQPSSTGAGSLGLNDKYFSILYVNSISLGGNLSFLKDADRTISIATSTADTDGHDLYLTAADGGAHSAANPDGGDIIATPGAAGSGGSGADGKFIVRQPGGVAGTDDLFIYHDGTSAYIQIASNQASWVDGDIQLLDETGTKKFGFSWDETWDGVNANWINSGDEALALQVTTGFYVRVGGIEFSVDGTRTTVARELEVNGAFNHDGTTVGLYGTTPATQPAHIVDADGTLSDITTKFNTLLAQHATLGLQAAR